MLNLKNKIAIVTGCGSVGNGWEMEELLLQPCLDKGLK